MSPFPGHVSIVSRVDHELSKENMDADRACADQKIAAVILVQSEEGVSVHPPEINF